MSLHSNHLTRRVVTGVAALAVAIPMLAACQSESSEQELNPDLEPVPPVSFGVLRAPTGALAVTTDEQGGFAEAGVEVDFESFAEGGGPAIVQAMAGSTPDLALLNTATVVLALGQGTFDVQMVSVAADPAEALPLLAVEGIKSVEDLRGKRVSVPKSGGQYYQLAAILEKHGMSFDDIEYKPLSVGEAQAAFITGQLEAVISSINGTVIIKDNVPGAHVLWDGTDFDKEDAYNSPDVLIATKEAVEENPEGLARFVRAFHEFGVAYLNDDETREEAIQAIQDYMTSVGAGNEDIEATEEGIDATAFFGLEEAQSLLTSDEFMNALNAQAEFWLDNGTITSAPDFESAIVADLLG